MAQKSIYLQTQSIKSGRTSPAKPLKWCAINIDNIKLIFDAYNGSGPDATPREESLIRLVDDKTVRELTATQLLDAVLFYEQYHAMGSDVISYRNVFHAVMPDHYLNAAKQRKSGLKF